MSKTIEGVDAYPCYWPEGWPRARRRERSRFGVTFAQARDGILHQLRLMSVGRGRVVISTNVPLRQDGLPYANMREPEDPAAAVYWISYRIDRGGSRQCIACDRWDRVRDNLRAIEKTLEALRGIERWGSTDIVARAFTGFVALPPPKTGWRAILGDCKTVEEASAAWKRLALGAHPDRGGSEERMVEINRAMDEAEKELLA